MKIYDIGEWIEFDFKNTKTNEIINCVGFITKKDLLNECYVVCSLHLKEYFKVPFYSAKETEVKLCKENYTSLIDVALDTKDKEWFNELVQFI